MQMARRRGFFRLWIVLAVIWIAVVGWNQYPLAHWGMDIRDGCFERLLSCAQFDYRFQVGSSLRQPTR
jgi:hypothetical protein